MYSLFASPNQMFVFRLQNEAKSRIRVPSVRCELAKHTKEDGIVSAAAKAGIPLYLRQLS